ncbi:RagB/SusD family nutrient uptake outer membrane protein [Flavobacteriaceae bacterium]|nr:RagB/SusD family nutrient uptake outer membrane protein [Flavobacteriaceae bacterium]
MMKNIFKNSLIAILFMGATFVACSDEFLVAPAQASLDEGTLANDAGVEASLIGTYSMLDGWNGNGNALGPAWPTAGSNWIWGSILSDDSYKGSDPGDQQQTQILEIYEFDPGNQYYDGVFKSRYEGVARANATINLLRSAVENGQNVQRASVVEAEAKLLRAHFHFDAWKMWRNVPFVDETVTDFKLDNSTDILPLIKADLEFAIANLPEVQTNIGRVTQGTARSLLGKLLLFNKEYGAAKTQFDAVMSSGTYSLQDCFHDIFTTGGENGTGMIFTIQGSVNDGDGGSTNGMFADRLNHPHGGSPFGCCGFHQPSHNLVNAHKVDANGLPMLDKSYNNADVTITDKVDPRLDWTVGRDDVPFLSWGKHEPTWIRNRPFGGPFSPKKFIHEPNEKSNVGWSNVQLSPLNIPIIRYADVILMLAEAEIEVGSLDRARELTNMVRERAAGCAINGDGASTSDIADSSITWASYDVKPYTAAWTSKDVARSAVRFERRIELALEGQRFFDLVRWGIAEDVINNDYLPVERTKRDYLIPSGGFLPKHNLHPLPNNQIELSKVDGEATLKQNPGY